MTKWLTFVYTDISSMYEAFFQLNEKPFSLTPSPRYIYLADQYRDARAKCFYFLNQRSASIYLSGPIGSGKTSLLRMMAQELAGDEKNNVAYIIAPNLNTSNALLRTICEEFGVKTERSYQGSLKNFNRFLLDQDKAGRFPVLLIDEAQNLPREALKLIHYMLNFVTNEKVLLMIILVGQEELAEKINRFPSLKSRMFPSALSSLTRTDMENLISYRWGVAAGNPKAHHPFTKEALDEIFVRSRGLPRDICKICDLALLQAFTRKKRQVTPAMVKMVVEDLTLNEEKKDA